MKTWQKIRNNPYLWQRYFVRENVIRAIRDFFDRQEFHEVETPILLAHPAAESYLDVFQTTLFDRHRKPTTAYLSPSPELALKKLLVSGIGNCYSMTKSFRNMETHGTLHSPEFTILEWYRVGADYTSMMGDCEQLLLAIHRFIRDPTNSRLFWRKGKAQAIESPRDPIGPRQLADPSRMTRSESDAIAEFTLSLPKGLRHDNKRAAGVRTLTYQGETIDLSPPWQRISVAEAFRSMANVDFEEFLDPEKARRIAHAKGYAASSEHTWEQTYNQIFLNEIEPRLGREKPTIIYDFPASMAALAKKKSSDPRFAERFELYIAGVELADCYSELTDWREQERRFQHEREETKRLGKTVYDYDHDFIEALKVGLPESSGIAVGVDRLVMLCADVTDIADTMLFPGKELFSSSDS